jgi:hypothetical protein
MISRSSDRRAAKYVDRYNEVVFVIWMKHRSCKALWRVLNVSNYQLYQKGCDTGYLMCLGIEHTVTDLNIFVAIVCRVMC